MGSTTKLVQNPVRLCMSISQNVCTPNPGMPSQQTEHQAHVFLFPPLHHSCHNGQVNSKRHQKRNKTEFQDSKIKNSHKRHVWVWGTQKYVRSSFKTIFLIYVERHSLWGDMEVHESYEIGEDNVFSFVRHVCFPIVF